MGSSASTSTSSTSFANDETHHVLITITLVILYCYVSNLVLKRFVGLEPTILETTQIEQIAHAQSSAPGKCIELTKRMTRGLDTLGVYRIETRATVHCILAMLQLLLSMLSAVYALSGFYTQHFINLDVRTVNYPVYRHCVAATFAYYLWELSFNHYARVHWNVAAHHWISILMTLLVLLGYFAPFATLYAITIIFMTFPVGFALAFRQVYGHKYPQFTRNLFAVVKYLFLWLFLFNFVGQIVLLVYRYSSGFLPVSRIVLGLIAMLGFVSTVALAKFFLRGDIIE
jgi:hypothetical protein